MSCIVNITSVIRLSSYLYSRPFFKKRTFDRSIWPILRKEWEENLRDDVGALLFVWHNAGKMVKNGLKKAHDKKVYDINLRSFECEASAEYCQQINSRSSSSSTWSEREKKGKKRFMILIICDAPFFFCVIPLTLRFSLVNWKTFFFPSLFFAVFFFCCC